jgi:hypothetical protein
MDDGLVTDLDAQDNRLTSHVQGGSRYNVSIGFDLNGEPHFSCDCDFFSGNEEPCKHLWATLMVADERGLLESMPDEEDSVGGPLQVTGPFAVRPNFMFGSSMRGANEPAWKRTLANLKDSPDDAPVSVAEETFPADARLIYVIDAEATRNDGRVCVQLAVQRRRRENSWHPPKRIVLEQRQWLAAPEPIDRQLVQMLFGVGTPLAEVTEATFYLDHLAIPTVLRMICDTGRALLKDGVEEREYATLSWDDGPAYELWLDTIASTRPRELQIRASLRRGDERLELEDPAVLLRGGYLIADGRVSAMETYGAFDLAAALRDRPQLSVPRENLREFVEDLYTLPGVPRLQLPEEAALEEIRPTAKPSFTIAAPEARDNTDELSGELTFDYAGRIVRPEDPRTGIVESDNRVTVRDRDADTAALRRLSSLGVRSERLRAKPREFRVPTAKLNDIVLNLVLEGWDVKAAGNIYRQPGQVSLSVASGIDWFDLHGSIDFGGQTASLPKLLQAVRKQQRTIVLDDGSIGVLPTEWLKQYAPLAGIGTVEDDVLRFTKSQIGFLDALLAAAPAA